MCIAACVRECMCADSGAMLIWRSFGVCMCMIQIYREEVAAAAAFWTMYYCYWCSPFLSENTVFGALIWQKCKTEHTKKSFLQHNSAKFDGHSVQGFATKIMSHDRDAMG